MSPPFNRIVTWTWYLLALAAALLRFGWTAESRLAQALLLAGASALGSGTLASNACAARRFARGETESFAVCDVVGVAVGAAVEAAVLRQQRLTDADWERVQEVPGAAREGLVETVAVVEGVVMSIWRRL